MTALHHPTRLKKYLKIFSETQATSVSTWKFNKKNKPDLINILMYELYITNVFIMGTIALK